MILTVDLTIICLLIILFSGATRHIGGSVDDPHAIKTLSCPDIFLIGVANGGTLPLNSLMRQNPQICSHDNAEKHFFDSEDQWRKGFSYYEDLYSMCSKDELVIDSTPVFHYQAVPARLEASYTPSELVKKRFILILRDPVSREFSAFQHRMQSCINYVNKSVLVGTKALIERVRHSCSNILYFHHTDRIDEYTPATFREFYVNGHLNLQDGEYESHLRNWLQSINRAQIFILNMDTLLVNTSDTMIRLRIFLGLKQGWITKQGKIDAPIPLPQVQENFHVKSVLDCETYDELWEYYLDKNQRLLSLIDTKFKPVVEPHFVPFEKSPTACVSKELQKARTCYSKLQKEVDCSLTHGQWTYGYNMAYKHAPALSKHLSHEMWESCPREVMPLIWKSDEKCLVDHHLKPVYSRGDICNIMNGRNVMIVGDSINNEFFVTFVSYMFPAGQTLTNDKFMPVGNYTIDASKNSVGVTIPCPFNISGFNIYFVRNYNLSTNLEMDPSYMAQIDRPRPWVPALNKFNISFLYMNRGAHFSEDKPLLDSLADTFSFLRQFHPNITVMYRTTPSGHRGTGKLECEEYFDFPAITAEQLDHFIGYNYHWKDFPHQNSVVRKFIAHQFPEVVLVDVANSTNLRVDSHIGGGDCLHYCIPGPIDNWVVSFASSVLHIDHAGCH